MRKSEVIHTLDRSLLKVFNFDKKESTDISTLIYNKDSAVLEEDKNIYCRICANIVTTKNEQIKIEGGHEHTFTNPHGFVYHITCYKKAIGAQALGEETAEFSWFRDYVWCYAICAHCRVHLGWRYYAAKSDTFFGLILDRLSISKH